MVMWLGLASLMGIGAVTALDRSVPAGAQAEDTVMSIEDQEQFFVDRVNQLRAELGLAPLQSHQGLNSLARAWSEQLRSQGALSHAPDLAAGLEDPWARLGENVGVAPTNQLEELFQAFVDSPSHYANLIRADDTYIGVGIVHGSDGRLWITQRFMTPARTAGETPSSTVPAPPSTQPPPTTVPATPETPAPEIADQQTHYETLQELREAVVESIIADVAAFGI